MPDPWFADEPDDRSKDQFDRWYADMQIPEDERGLAPVGWCPEHGAMYGIWDYTVRNYTRCSQCDWQAAF